MEFACLCDSPLVADYLGGKIYGIGERILELFAMPLPDTAHGTASHQCRTMPIARTFAISAGVAIAATVVVASSPVMAQLRGHGGPVRALAVAPSGDYAVSGSFDTSAIIWSLRSGTAERVLRFHTAAVNAVTVLDDGRIATAGADGRIAIWRRGESHPDRVLEGHDAPIAGLAVSPDRKTLASASWDHTVRLWPLAGGAPRVLEGHSQNVNGVAFAPDGRFVVSVGYDLSLRIWPLSGGEQFSTVMLPSPLNAVLIAPDGEIITAGADGNVYFLNRDGVLTATVQAAPSPVISLAISDDGVLVAAASIRGSVAIINRNTHTLARTLVGPGLPVWSLAFLPKSHTLLTGGTDRMIRRWDAVTGDPIDSVVTGTPEDPLAPYVGDRGAEVFRACIACHTLSASDGPRAGPTLAGLYGRRIASLPGYDFSDALKKLSIVWTPETVSKLFELGPSAYTPGTKMPEQTIGSPDDRKALTEFLARATAN